MGNHRESTGSRNAQAWRWSILSALLLLVLVSAPSAHAQGQTGSIEGMVVGPSGNPVAGVVVSTSDSAGTPYSATTDSSGDFTLSDLPAPASYNLTFSPPSGYEPTTDDGVSVFPDDTMDIGQVTLPAEPGSISGLITDSNGRPLAGMQVVVTDPSGVFVPGGIVNSGRDGRYLVAGLQPGPYQVAVSDAGRSVNGPSVSVSSGAASTENFQLPPPPVPRGTHAHESQRDLGYLNAERAADGLPSGIAENPRWSTECAAHDSYLFDNHTLVHPENPHRRGASPGGNWAGTSSVLDEGFAWFRGTNPWENAPIHLIQLFSPSLNVIGIDQSHGYTCATTLPGLSRRPVTHDTVFTYPGNRERGVPPFEIAEELPFVPGQFVGIPEGAVAGRELFVYLNQAGQPGQAQVKILAARLTSVHGPARLRWVDNTTPTVGPYLTGGILLPVKPLRARTRYTATVTVRDGTGTLSHTWSFTTENASPLTFSSRSTRAAPKAPRR